MPAPTPVAPTTPELESILLRMDLNFAEMYRQHVRHIPGGEAHDYESLTVIYGPEGEAIHNPVMVHGPTTLERLLGVAARSCRELGRKHAIFLRAHADQHLEAGLEAAGYRLVYGTPGMYLTRARFRPVAAESAALEIRPVTSDAEALVYGERVAEAFAIYGIPAASVRSFFVRRESLENPSTQGYIGYLDGEPVTGAILYASHGVAGVGWVWTRPTHFGKRLAEAATSAVLADGFGRGLEIANLQASPLGQKVYARMGFDTPTEYKTFLPTKRVAA